MIELSITFIASFLIWAMVFLLFYNWKDKKFKKEHIFHAGMAGLLVWLIASFVKDLFPAVRPFQINGYPPLTLTVPFSSTFPSTHTAVAFAIATSAYLHNKRLGLRYFVIALFVALGRYLSNVHFFIDIIGGSVLGITISIITAKIHLPELTKKLIT